MKDITLILGGAYFASQAMLSIPWVAAVCIQTIEEPDLQTMDKTILRYMDEGEEKSVVQKIEQLKSEIKALYDIACMI